MDGEAGRKTKSPEGWQGDPWKTEYSELGIFGKWLNFSPGLQMGGGIVALLRSLRAQNWQRAIDRAPRMGLRKAAWMGGVGGLSWGGEIACGMPALYFCGYRLPARAGASGIGAGVVRRGLGFDSTAREESNGGRGAADGGGDFAGDAGGGGWVGDQ